MSKLPVAGETLVHVFERELDDLQAHWPLQTPGWLPVIEAYSRVVISSVCEAFLELRLGHRASREDMSGAFPTRQHADRQFGPQQQAQKHASDQTNSGKASKGSSLSQRRTKSQSPLRKPQVTPTKASSTRRRSVPPRSSGSIGSPSKHVPSVDTTK